MPALLESIPSDWGPKLATEAGAVTCTRTGPNEIQFKASAHMALVMFTPQPNREVALDSDRRTITMAPAGTVELVPEGSELFARWTVRKENLLLALDQGRLSQLAGMEFQNENFAFHPPKPAFTDQKAFYLANLLRQEFQQGEAKNRLYVDALITVFGTHLLRAYSSLGGVPDYQPRGGLSPKAWRSVMEYIDANLAKDLSIDALAKVAGLSPSYFLRAFRHSSGQAPHQYVLAQRLALSARLIKTTRLPYRDIAKASGFSSHSHMTTTMKRAWGVIPSKLGRNDET